jgi:hypothetical protein
MEVDWMHEEDLVRATGLWEPAELRLPIRQLYRQLRVRPLLWQRQKQRPQRRQQQTWKERVQTVRSQGSSL